MSETRECKACGKTKPITEFTQVGMTVRGVPTFRGVCKACYTAARKSQRAAGEAPPDRTNAERQRRFQERKRAAKAAAK